MDYTIRQITAEDHKEVRDLDSESFGKNERGSSAELHRLYADNIRKSPYFIPELDLIAVEREGLILGHAIFSAIPMGDRGEHVVWLNSLAVRHDDGDSHTDGRYQYQRKGIGTALVRHGLKTAAGLGYTACMTCGNPKVYRDRMGFRNYLDFGIKKDESVDEPDGALSAILLKPEGFQDTNHILSFGYYDFFI